MDKYVIYLGMPGSLSRHDRLRSSTRNGVKLYGKHWKTLREKSIPP